MLPLDFFPRVVSLEKWTDVHLSRRMVPHRGAVGNMRETCLPETISKYCSAATLHGFPDGSPRLVEEEEDWGGRPPLGKEEKFRSVSVHIEIGNWTCPHKLTNLYNEVCCNRVKLSSCKRCMIHAKFMRIRLSR